MGRTIITEASSLAELGNPRILGTLPPSVVNDATSLVDKLVNEVVNYDSPDQRKEMANYQAGLFLGSNRENPVVAAFIARSVKLVEADRTLMDLKDKIEMLPEEVKESAKELIDSIENEVVLIDGQENRVARARHYIGLYLPKDTPEQLRKKGDKIKIDIFKTSVLAYVSLLA